MKNFFIKFIFFISLLGFFVILLNVGLFQKTKRIALCAPDRVESIGITNELGTVTVSTANGEWFVETGGFKGVADALACEQLSKALCHLSYTEKFTFENNLSNDQKKTYGFDPFEAEVKMSADRQVVLHMGARTPDTSASYVLNQTEPGILYTVPSLVVSSFSAGLFDLAGRRVLANLGLAESIQLTMGGQYFTLKLGEGVWRESQDKILGPDAQQLVTRLQALKYVAYNPLITDDDRDKFSIDSPDVELVWNLSQQPVIQNKIVLLETRSLLTITASGVDYALVLESQSAMALKKTVEDILIKLMNSGL